MEVMRAHLQLGGLHGVCGGVGDGDGVVDR